MATTWAWAYQEDVPIATTAWEVVASGYDSAATSVTSADQYENVHRRDSSKTPQYKHVGEGPLDREEIEMWVIGFTNEERRKAGLEPLQLDPTISAIARSHGENMVGSGLFLHRISGKDATDRAIDAGYNCRAYHDDGSYSYGLSENIAERPRVSLWIGRGSSYRPNIYELDSKAMARGLVEQWMDSPGHRENILDRESHKIGVGVAVAEQVEYGYVSETVYATQNFSACR